MARTWNGYHVLTGLLGVFALVLSVNILFVVKAYTTFSGEDEQKPYLQGVQYNSALERRALQTRLGWRATLEAMRAGRGEARVGVAMSDRRGAPISGLSLVVTFKHLADADKDREIKLRSVAPGIYEGSASDISSGAWDLVVSATNAPKTPFEATRRVWIR
jgi:nitrogen fixation protein FixH